MGEGPAPATSNGLRILVVDDDRDTTDALQVLLAGGGHEVAVAYRGSEALELVATRQFDVILSDIGLPEEDGMALARRIRGARDFRGTLLALTGYADDDTLQELKEAGYAEHFAKPVDIVRLRELLDRLGSRGGQGTAPG